MLLDSFFFCMTRFGFVSAEATIPNSRRTYTADELIPGHRYTFTIKAQARGRESEPTTSRPTATRKIFFVITAIFKVDKNRKPLVISELWRAKFGLKMFLKGDKSRGGVLEDTIWRPWPRIFCVLGPRLGLEPCVSSSGLKYCFCAKSI